MSEPTFHVIFRTCDIVHSLHNAPRPFGLDKRTLIKICFLSLYQSLKDYPHTIHILGDRLSEEMLKFFGNYPVTISNEELGNDKSILRSIEIASAKPDGEWVYLCEDDYLHRPESFLWLRDLISGRDEYISKRPRFRLRAGMNMLKNVPFVIHTADYPDRYRRNQRKYSLLFISKYCHWRQISNTTFTFLAEGSTFKRFKRILNASAAGARDGYLSKKLYGAKRFTRKVLCLSPIPGIATHMHEEVMTPLVNWEAIYKNLLHDLEG